MTEAEAERNRIFKWLENAGKQFSIHTDELILEALKSYNNPVWIDQLYEEMLNDK